VIALDTNVLVRYLVRDDPRQTRAATRVVETSCTVETPGLVTLVVLCELVWVLERGYRYSRVQIAALVRGLLAADDLSIERSELAWQALNAFEEGPADFADYVIGGIGREAGAEATVTFDRRAGASPLFRQLEP
jgi:predicted nucleic-acid-binding protein